MKRVISLLFLLLVSGYGAFASAITIAAARSLPVGSTVTISGIVLNGPELGTIRYVQDGTGGIGVFSLALSSTVKGDLVSVTGVTDDYFNLLEINPVTSWNLISSGNPLPLPAIITPSQLDETVEGELVQINSVTFSNPGGLFTGNATFGFSANGQPGVIYLRSNSPLVGTSIPSGNVTLTGICSQNNLAYQVLPRDTNDLVSSGSIQITVPPVQLNITTSGFDIQWETNVTGSTYINFGNSPALGSTLTGTAGTTHLVTVSGATASEVFYVKAFSVSGNDTAFSDTKVFITASNSSGAIKAYFNRTVDHAVANAPTNYAIQLNNAIDDTLKAYIDRCQQTLDIAIYNFDNVNTTQIIQAINDAYSRGVQIRIISDGSNNNAALPSLNAAIPKVSSPTIPALYYGIMHNKFVVMDANASNADLPVVWTGSTNWSNDQLYTDANNVIIFQDQSLAVAYTMEFNEMWGSAGMTPVPANAKFGPDKADNTPHEFLIGGKRVENYFSPSDNVNYQIIKTINAADAQLFFSTYVFTRYDLAFAIEDRVNHGIYTAGIVDDSSNGGGYPYSIMQSVMGNKIELYDHPSLPGILHHKYMIVDQLNASLDPLVLTGSHNWSNTANLKNDENTVIVHDENISNQYYQEFYKRFYESGGTLGVKETEKNSPAFMLYPNPAHDKIFIEMELSAQTSMTIMIMDLTGKILIKKNITAVSGSNQVQLNGAPLAPGMYLVRVNAGGWQKFQKVVVE